MAESKFETNILAYNTMHVSAETKGIIPVYSEQKVFEILVQGRTPLRVLGGGSNILVAQDQEAYLLKNEIKGIEIVDEDDEIVLVSVGAGEIWHNLVQWAISHDLGGIENLAFIPGCVGAAPIQNIGAYGVEQKSVFHSLKAIHLEDGTSKVFFNQDCKFGYRDSVFKKKEKGKYIIIRVNYIFTKKNTVNCSYGAIQDVLKRNKITNPTITDVAEAIIEIRKSKLPDPKIIPNSGSFFKNPIVDIDLLKKLKVVYPDIVYFEVDTTNVKIPAAWLIDKTGFKGMRDGDAGVHKKHALVLVNYGNASGKELLAFSKRIQNAVADKFGIQLECEVNIW